ncbi:hypothetical protein P692DRAFT_201807848 [Suillus brevipes Sb2]|nr:hypothetical protein P692DRAFT_201807848 [Suillus brevipes Sb2]
MRILPRSLWYLIHVTLAQAQQLTVSVAICSTGTTSPAFFVNNNTASTSTTDDFEIPLHSGFGNWTGTTQQGGLLVVQSVGQTSFQVAASTGVALVHELIPALPFLGDTTNTQALIFSPPISPIESSPSAYPNYTLPPANLSAPAPPSSPPSFSLVIAPTSSNLASGMQTACRINSTSSAGLVCLSTAECMEIAEAKLLNRDDCPPRMRAWQQVSYIYFGLLSHGNICAYVEVIKPNTPSMPSIGASRSIGE